METVAADPSVLADVVILIIFFIFVVIMGNRGFFDSLAPLIVTVISIVAALLLSRLMAEPIAEHVYPWAAKQLANRMDLSAIRTPDLRDISSQLAKLMPETMTSLMRKLQVELLPYVQQAMEAAVPQETAQRIAEDAVSAVMLPVTRSVVHILLFFALFLFFKLVLSMFKNLLGLAFELPGFSLLDHLGGALIGAAWCAVFLYIVCWLLDLFFPTQFVKIVESSRILSLFIRE